MKEIKMILTTILTPQNLKCSYYRRGVSLRVYELANTIFLVVKSYKKEGNTTEVLRCIYRKQGLFKLLTRKPDNSIPMSTVILRHQKFPLGCTVRLKQIKLLLPPLTR